MSTLPSSLSFDLIISGGTVVNHAGRAQADIGIRDGRFAALGNLSAAKAASRFDARGLTILPGVIDTQVHMREPGTEHKEDLATGTAGAALGGVTGIFEMPNTKPSTTTAEALNDKFARAAIGISGTPSRRAISIAPSLTCLNGPRGPSKFSTT